MTRILAVGALLATFAAVGYILISNLGRRDHVPLAPEFRSIVIHTTR